MIYKILQQESWFTVKLTWNRINFYNCDWADFWSWQNLSLSSKMFLRSHVLSDCQISTSYDAFHLVSVKDQRVFFSVIQASLQYPFNRISWSLLSSGSQYPEASIKKVWFSIPQSCPLKTRRIFQIFKNWLSRWDSFVKIRAVNKLTDYLTRSG